MTALQSLLAWREPDVRVGLHANMFFTLIATALTMTNFTIAPKRDEIIDTSDITKQNKSSGILGTIAKIASPPPFFPSDAVTQKFLLQSAARQLLPSEKVSQCLRAVIPGKPNVEIHHDPQKCTAHYKNLITCGRLWQCPVCATRITEQRAAELLQAVTRWHDESGFVVLATFTLQHNIHDNLTSLLEALIGGHRRFKSGAPFQRMTERYGWHGSVRALEVTYGENGWHPHLHELIFMTPLSLATFSTFPGAVKARWLSSLEHEGADASWEYGADVREAESDVYEYLAKFGKLPKLSKWTIEREVAKAPTKKGHADGKTPFQLLQDYIDGDERAGQLFQEYTQAFKGRNQLVWSRNLREKLDLPDALPDELLAALLPDESVLLASLELHHWKQIMSRADDFRGVLLSIASTGDKTRLLAFLAELGIVLENWE